ncbi:MAG: filamentous hemagglutinin family protein [Steroidobacteraceae bacterium]
MDAKPPSVLPTPCLAGNCGSSAQTFVSYGAAGASVSGTTMTVTQASANAILNWANFNIASGYKVNFVQPSATAEILNNIWSANPSVIAGAMNANGQVYLYNQNGILFNKGAQINVGGLTASTLNFAEPAGSTDPDALFKNGILSNNVNAAVTGTLPAVFQTSAAAAGSGGYYTCTPAPCTVTVSPGAVLTAADGGRIMLLGQAVTNQGTISTPDGQTILGAGNTVYLAASSDPSLRGLLIEVNSGNVGGTGSAGSAVSNQGDISAARGNVTLAGMIVNQAGTVSATTSVSANGSIYLVAGDTSATASGGQPESYYDNNAPGFGTLLPNQGGQLTLAPGSVTEVLPDATSTATVSEQNLVNFIPSQVALVGQSVTLQGSASVRAPGATVLVNAATNPSNQFTNPGTAYNDGGRIYLDSGSSIDVSGLTNVPVAVTNNILQVTLEGDDLQNDPLLRNGFLHGTTVTVNASQGSTLFNVAPYAGNIEVGIDQVLTAAGSIQLNSDGDVIARAGSTLNVSGGSIAYQGGLGPSTTKLLGSNGLIYGISDAPNDIQYVSTANSYSYTDPTWGTTTSVNSQTYYPGYVQGANAGEIEVLGPQVYLRGNMLAATVVGPYQRAAGTLAQGGLFELGCGCNNAAGDPDYRAPAVLLANGATDVLGNDFDYANLDAALPADLQAVTTLSPAQLTGSGFNRIAIYSNGVVNPPAGGTANLPAGTGVYLPAGTSLNLAAGGFFDVTTDQSIAINGNINIAGSLNSAANAGVGGPVVGELFSFLSMVDVTVTPPGATVGAPSAVDLVTKPFSSGGTSDPVAHNISLGAGAVIDVDGSWVNDSPALLNNAPGTAPIAINGGNVILNAENGNVLLGAGSRIDVSGGGWVNSGNQLSAGSAGAIDLIASYLPVNSAPYQGSVSIGAGASLLGNSLTAGQGGSLSITSGSVTVGWSASGTPGELLLSPDFFLNQGFASYSITGQNDVMIGSTAQSGAKPVTIAPIQENLVFTQDMLLEPTGSNMASFTALEPLLPSQRSPASISFTATGFTATGAAADSSNLDNGSVLLGENASIITDPLASVSLWADSQTGSVTVLGSILAPAGDITLQVEGSKFDTNPTGEYVENQQILLGPHALLDAPAYAQINTLDPLGYRQGSVLSGGTISLQANKGYVVTDPGSVINVGGTAAVIDVQSSNGVTPTTVAGNAGSIDIDAREGIVLQGSLQGQAATFNGAPVARAGGGTLSVGLDLFDYAATLVAENGNSLYSVNARTLTLAGPADYVPSNQLQSGVAQIGTASIETGGFDTIVLKSADIIAIEGAVSLASKTNLTLDAPVLQGDPGASLHLNSAYVALGNYYNEADYFDIPTSGGGTQNPNAATVLASTCTLQCTATLSVSAQLIDIRGITGWSGFSSETLTSSGDIRLTSAENPVNTPPALETVPGDASQPSLRSALNTAGSLTLQAQQIYPTTNTDFTITSGSSVTIAASPGTAATPLSAGGILTINAPTITQGGVLRAPLGEITLNAVNGVDPATGLTVPGSVTLTAGSLTSVSADGLVIPYGSTVNGQQWTYSPDSLITEVITAPPAKAINLSGADVSVNKGATVDLSGGGDLYAYEFIAGEGGSLDVLSPANAAMGAYTYAILPSLGSAFSPIDAQYQQGSKATGNQTIYLSGVPGLATGSYALLPAYYALLPGAYAVQIEKPNSGIVSGPAVEQSDGAYVTAGRLGVAGTEVAASLNSTVLIAPGSVVRTQSQYTDTYASSYFSAAAASNQTAVPSLPADAGDLQISATSALALNGSINFATGSYQSGTTSSGAPITVQGAGGAVSIEAPNILVVDSATPAGAGSLNGALQVNAQSLDNLGAQTIVLGATTQNTAAGEQITAGATQAIELDNASVALTAPEIILAAQNAISVDAGAQINAKGTLDAAPTALVLQGAGALLRASSGAAAPLTVETTNSAGQAVPQNPAGQLSIGADATVKAGGSLLLYSTGNTTAQPDATLSAPALGLYSSRVSLGDVPTGAGAPGGLNLSTQLLGQLSGLTALTIGSTSTIDFYGTVNLGAPGSATPGLANITLDAWAVDGYGSGNKVLQAGAITLQNSNENPNADATTPVGVYSSTPSGTGALTLRAVAANSSDSGQITLGAGTKTLAGFSAVNLDATGDIQGQGTGTLNVGIGAAAVPLTLQGAALTAASASGQSIITGGAVTLLPAGAGKTVLPAPPIGGEVSIEGSSIAQNGVIDLPAGIIALEATNGDLVLGKGSITSAAGSAQSFVVTDAVAAGGRISLVADLGNVTLAGGATVDVAGTSSPDGKVSGGAGSLSVSAPQGTFQFAGATLEGSAPAGQLQGNFTLDESSGLAGTGFSALNNTIAGSGFTGALSLQTGAESVNVTGDVNAGSFVLSTSNAGSITVSGIINTSGGNALDTGGGTIQLWAGTGLTLEPGAQLLANAGAAGPVGVNGSAAPAQGGNITLGTATGYLTVNGGTPQAPTVISMQGGGGAATDGTLTLRAPRTADDSNVQIQVQNPGYVNVNTRQAVVVEGFKTYSAADLGSTDSNCGSGGSCDIADLNGVLFTDAASFEANAPAITAALGLTKNGVQVRPGIEIDSTGDLVLDNSTTAWDLDGWNAAFGAPVNLTLRAAGNLLFNSSLSDGFTNNSQSVANWTFGESAADLDSASYRLTAGADLTAANPLAVITQPISTASTTGTPTPNAGNLIVTPGNLIRTGDGSIDIAAGGDVLLGYNYSYDINSNLQVTAANPLSSVIYTAGIPSTLTAAQSALFTPPAGTGRVQFTASYPTGGGNVTVTAADDIMSAPSEQLVSDWLWREGSVNATTGAIAKNTSWWIVFGDFEQGIGALGGGNVSLTAGRNIVNVSAVVPSTGELLGLTGSLPSSSNLLVYGAGNLLVQAGGNIESGVFEDDWGNASISAGGALTSGTTLGAEIPTVQQQNLSIPLTTPIFPVLLVGTGTFDVSARSGITINSVANGTTTPQTVGNTQDTRPASYYFTYGANSTLNIDSTGGDVVMQNDGALLPVSFLNNENGGVPNLYSLAGDFGFYYPPTVNIAALSGNVILNSANSGLNLFPSATGNLSLLAQGSITGVSTLDPTGTLEINMYETSPASWASPLAPQAGLGAPPNNNLPQQPLYQNETQPVYIVADTGNISAGQIDLPKAADVIAGGNITDLDYTGKNLNPSDVTLIEAGGNISYTTPTAALTNQLLQNSNGIQLAGTGYLEVLAGGSLNLGDSDGIVTTGNLTDPRLASSGASLVAGAGFGSNSGGGLRQPASQSFINSYLAPNAAGTPGAYAGALTAYMQQLYPAGGANSSYGAALTSFEALTPAQQLPLLAQVLSDVLSATGLAHTTQGASYAPGFAAINTLFPATNAQGNTLAYQGDIDMFYSQLKTEQGGDINLLVPGGSVIVGVPNPSSALNSIKATTDPTVAAAANLGLLVLGQGAIEGFANENFEVNQSRILTLEGGDIILWASNGSIDAGNGAKSASGAPPPVIETSASGTVFVNPVNDVSGSGIGQLLTGPNETAGLVNLIAPNGDVNAGDAGIRVAGNLNIAAVQVIGAGNISVVGTSTGVPVSEAGALAGALSGANSLGDASKNAVDQLSQDLGSAANYQQLTDNLQPTFISVKMFCLGVQCETQ